MVLKFSLALLLFMEATVKAEHKALIAIGTGVGLAVAAKKQSNWLLRRRIKDRLMKFDREISHAAATWKVPKELIQAVIWVESRGNPKAKRYEKAIDDYSYGLMQVTYSTAKYLGYKGPPEGLLDVKTNLHYGTYYLAKQLMRYEGDVAKAVAAYNAGSAQYVGKKFKNQSYVDKVLKAYWALLEEAKIYREF